jgi:hypothetical protein
VIPQRSIELRDDVVREPFLPDQYDRFPVVAETAEVFALRFGEGHGMGIGDRG